MLAMIYCFVLDVLRVRKRPRTPVHVLYYSSLPPSLPFINCTLLTLTSSRSNCSETVHCWEISAHSAHFYLLRL